MDEYIGKEVKIDLDNKMYYRGKVLSAGIDYISIRDINDKLVYINLKNVISIKEVSK
jgi:hypothetical protein